jgi:hypothetical protein
LGKLFIKLFLLSLAISAIPFFLFKGPRALYLSVLSLVVFVIVLELLFRIVYRFAKGYPYKFIPKVPFKKNYVEPHPNLPYITKKHFATQKDMPSTYSMHKDKGYIFKQTTTNNYGYSNGPGGDRDIKIPKPKGLIRINCMGDSITGNDLFYIDKNYSYPMELEEILMKRFPGAALEVNNCGDGGYTTAEILIRFLLDTIDTKPDVVILYNVYFDLQASLAPNFQNDYSHFRRNLGETYYLYKIASMLPDLPLAFWNCMLNSTAFGQNIRYTLMESIAKERPDINNDFKGLGSYERNIEHLVNICKASGIEIILSTLAYYLYPSVKDDKSHLKYYEGIKQENDAMRRIAARHKVTLVDNYALVPSKEEYFVDSIHFSPEGMQLVAKNISVPIIEYISKRP